MSRPRTLVVFVLLVALAGLMLAGCRAREVAPAAFTPQPRDLAGEARPFLLGFSDIPGELTTAAYRETYDRAANYGEALLTQRPPAWSDFLPGARVSDDLREQTLAEREAARARGLATIVALDPYDPAARGRLQGLPSSHAERDLSDPALRQAFLAEAVFIARNTEPDYLVLGSEINATYERNPEAYAQFVTLYAEAYDAVKEVAPETQVLVTFQYEELRGVIPWQPPHAPRWELLEDFDGRLDLVGLTTYPSFTYSVARKVPPNYYLELREHTDLPIAFVSAGFSSGDGRDGINASTPAEQRRFLERLLDDAAELRSPLVVWFATQDFSFAASSAYELLSNIGLRDEENEPKEAWEAWVTASRRPYDPAMGSAVASDATPDDAGDARGEGDDDDAGTDGESGGESGDEPGETAELTPEGASGG